MSEYSAIKNISTYNCGKISKTTKEFEKNEARERKRNLLYLIVSYLHEQNLHDSADALTYEAQLSNQFEVCDNIDLDIMYQDYQTYYFTKFNKKLKTVKHSPLELRKPQEFTALHKRKQKLGQTTSNLVGNGETLVKGVANLGDSPNLIPDFQIDVTSLTQKQSATNISQNVQLDRRQLPPEKFLSEFDGYNTDWKEMADVIVKEFIPKTLGINWQDCIGVNKCIEQLKEAAIYPLKFPELFNGLIAPWKGILLYGPPGTGKTLLAKALACEAGTTFINVSSSSFISKWRGESEKMIKVLFDVARHYAPTTIFIDEIDGIAPKCQDMQHDASRRFKSELLIQIDGILSTDDRILVLATSNSPWSLDTAMLRRFEKRILLTLPSHESRIKLFKHFFKNHSNNFQEADYKRMVELTENYSGSDIKLVCKESIMTLVREKLVHMPFKIDGNFQDKALRNVKLADVLNALEKINPAADFTLVKKYDDWAVKYGSN